MIKNDPTSIVVAFEMLLEEIEAEIDFVDRAGARGFELRDYDRAKEALERAAQVTAFRDKVDMLRREWTALLAQDDEEGTETHVQRRNLGRLKRGSRTREEAYYRPILEVLEALKGSAQVSEVLERVQQQMAGVLRDVDYEPLASDPDMPRWKNAAQWARNSMVKEGLLRNDSPRGVWQISEDGKVFLKKNV